MTMPFLISLPHAGTDIPSEVREFNLLSFNEIVKDGDEGAAQTYTGLEEYAQAFVTTNIARAYVDMNRDIDDFRDDGVVKTMTCWQEPIYSKPLPKEVIRCLLTRYYDPYHTALEEVYSSDIVLGVDCHTMAAFGPPIGPDPGRQRPMVCLGDRHGQTLPNKWMDALVECFSDSFDEPVVKNVPFSGGHITRYHGRSRPWVQVEVSRCPSMTWEHKQHCVLQALESFHRWLG